MTFTEFGENLVQTWSGYQGYIITNRSNRYIPRNEIVSTTPCYVTIGWVNSNRYLTRASDGNMIFITTTDNVHVASWVLFRCTVKKVPAPNREGGRSSTKP